MAEKLEILFIMFEGLPFTVIDSQVLMHVRHIQENTDYRFEIWSFAPSKALYKLSLSRIKHAENMSGATVQVFPALRPSVPFSHFFNAQKIKNLLMSRNKPFAMIHARTDYTAACCSQISNLMNIPVIWDCRGAAMAEFLDHYKTNNFLDRGFAFLKIRALNKARTLAASGAAGAIFVSRPLEELNRDVYPSKPREVIPCAAAGELFFFNKKIRSDYRKNLGVQDNQTLFIYSGSLAQYQCFDETLALFKKISLANPLARLLVLTTELACARESLKTALEDGTWQLVKADLTRVNAYLNAADVGIMLRRPIKTNQVASPTKFAEYVLSGLRVIMNDSVIDSVSIARSIDAYLDESDAKYFIPDADSKREAICTAARSQISRSCFTLRYKEFYDLMFNQKT